MASHFYSRALRGVLNLAIAFDRTGDRYVRVSVKRRTWRTLWLVERTYRVKVPIVSITLSTSSYCGDEDRIVGSPVRCERPAGHDGPHEQGGARWLRVEEPRCAK